MDSFKIKKCDIISLLLLYTYAIFSISGSLTHILLYVAIPGSFVFLWFGNKNIKSDTSIKLSAALFLWLVICSFFAINSTAATLEVRRFLCVFLLMYSVFVLANKKQLIPYVYLIWIFMYGACIYYAQSHLLVDFDYTQDRVNDQALNANTLGYYTFFVTYILFYFGEIAEKRRNKLMMDVLFLATIPLSFYIAIITASRQILIIQIPLILLLLYVRYFMTTRSNKFVLIVAGIIAVYAIVNVFADIYSNSYLSVRNTGSAKDDVRVMLIETAIQTGLEHPFFGVGPGCFGKYNGFTSFSHCTYTELFANTGFIGVILFICLVGKFIINQWKRYRITKDSFFLLFFIIGLIFAMDNMFYVFYLDPWLMAFFTMIYTHSDTHYKQYI